MIANDRSKSTDDQTWPLDPQPHGWFPIVAVLVVTLISLIGIVLYTTCDF